MDMVPVTSSNIASIGYNPETSTLAVQFTNGGLYEYDGVNEDVFTGLKSADSVGKFFHATVKNKFSFRKIN